MSASTMARRPLRALATTTALGVAAAGLALAAPSAPAQAVETDSLTGAALTWGISDWLSSPNPGRLAPYAAGYVAPATFDDASGRSTWSADAGTVGTDGAADIDFDGTSVSFAKTSGAWMKFADPKIVIDDEGNGTVAATVSYGMSEQGAPGNRMYDDSEAATLRAATEVDVVALSANSAAVLTAGSGAIDWVGLDGTWSPEFLDFVDGDADAPEPIEAFPYAGQISDDAGKDARPFDLSITTAVPTVTYEISSAATSGFDLTVRGDGFRGVTNPGDMGIYVGLAPAGGAPDLTSQEGRDAFAAQAWIAHAPIPGATGTLEDGAFIVDLAVARNDVDPRVDYSLYTWQAHTHSNTTQDTETPVTIDWAAVGFPVKSTSKLTVKKPTTKKAGKATVVVSGKNLTPSGKVKITFKAKGKKAKVWTKKLNKSGKVSVKLPKSKKGKASLKVSYKGDAAFKSSQATKKFRVKK